MHVLACGIHVCTCRHTLQAIPQLGPQQRDEARRLVTLLDVAYDRGTALVCSAGEWHAALGAYSIGAGRCSCQALQRHEACRCMLPWVHCRWQELMRLRLAGRHWAPGPPMLASCVLLLTQPHMHPSL